MPNPVWSNPLLLARATSLQTLLNAGHHLRLFTNNFAVTPATPLSSFVEATFAGYVAKDLTAVFTGPTFVVDGEYQIDSGAITFMCTAGTQTVYGWYIDDGVNMKAAQLFDTPVVMVAGKPLPLQLRPNEISQSIL